MTRAHVTALALVNWKGVFYERYRLDRHVTALEGANGAGKTTVMIAAYLVLLPDLSRVRFSNIGESGATGGDRGIWGRLGEAGRPSYAALDLQLPSGARVIAGVRLRRMSEPSVELSTFLLEKLPAELPLSELFLLRSEHEDQICEQEELKSAVKRAGGAFQAFRSVKEYFSALFERGITPLRLGSDEDRHKYNEMLRTSMTGGISRVLTSELRNFLLKEEGGLGDVLGRMRNNLDACRRTRGEVGETRAVERDISSVYEAGEAMFSSAYHAARCAAAEAQLTAERARAAAQTAERSARQLAAEVEELAAAETALDPQLAAASAEHEASQARLDRLRAASALALKLQSLDSELEALDRRAQAARAAQMTAQEQRGRLREQREQAQAAYERAALGLANLQTGLEELHRRAHAQRELTRSLEEARNLLETPSLSAQSIAETVAALRAQCATWQTDRARAKASEAAAIQRRNERDRALEALAALETILPRKPPASDSAHLQPSGPAEPARGADDALGRARCVLRRVAECELELARLSLLEFECGELSHWRGRQRAAWERARAIGIEPGREAGVELEQRWEQAHRRASDLERSARMAHEQLAQASARLERARAERDRLERSEPSRQARAAARARIASVLGCEIAQPSELAAARERLAEESFLLNARRGQLQTDREAWLKLASDLSGPGAALDPDLIRLRDELNAELLIEHYDALSGEEAAALEARIGPLSQALLVSDPAARAISLLDKPRALDTLWLVRAGQALEPVLIAQGREDVVVEQAFGARLTRMPAQPSVGARARSARAAALRERAEQAAGALEQLSLRVRDLAALHADFELLSADLELSFASDPSAALAALATEIERAAAAEQVAHSELESLRALSASQRADLERLERLSADRTLLEAADPGARSAELEARIRSARTLQPQLAQLRTLGRELSELLDTLREAPEAPERIDATRPMSEVERHERLEGGPPSDAGGQRLAQLGWDGALDWGYRTIGALERVSALAHAAEWQDAAAALESRAELVPSLKQQHDRARQAVTESDRAVLEADAAWERATASAQHAAADRSSAAAQRERVQAELSELGGIPDASLASRAERALREAAERRAEFERSARTIVAALSRARERASQAERDVEPARAAAERGENAAAPAQRSWAALRRVCEAAALVASAPDPDAQAPELSASAAAGLSGAEPASRIFAAAAGSGKALLIDRLSRSRGGEDLAARIQAAEILGSGLPAELDRESGRVLEAWIWTRDWLRRRVPLQLAEADEPLRALGRLRDQLDVLAGRLARQEAELRGASADVARGIEVQVRRARAQVRRLNQHLEGVRFGSIAALRVELRRVERMEQILRALREGEVQELLFQPSLPIEEALAEIFRRYGAGRSTGQRLLDYREYVELAVEIKRQSAADWESASPTRLSTGEAIGVGAALMMVVLTEWERDAHLLRAGPEPGSLRFLFLDEANRLSRDNLGVLFELCRNLDLQLMIAAPEVARAEGNTTYRLVRQISEDGREEVIVSGRRAVEPQRDSHEASQESEANPAELESGSDARSPVARAARPEGEPTLFGDRDRQRS